MIIPIATAVMSFGVRYGWAHWGPGRAVAIYPTFLNLGPRDKGDVAVGRFEIQNAGRGELTVERFGTSCSCAGVEMERDGQFVKVRSIRIAPGARTELAVRMSVGAPIGESQPVTIMFRTSDPARPVGKIDLVVPLVTGGIFSSPRAVVLGRVQVGAEAKQIVNLYDASALSRRVVRARSTRPERFDVRLLPPPEQKGPLDSKQQIVARLEVLAQSKKPGRLEGDIEIYLEGEKLSPDTIPITGEVVSGVSCSPSLVAIPRYSEGQKIYRAEVSIQGDGQEIVDVRVLSTPQGIGAVEQRVNSRTDCRSLSVWCETGHGAPEPASESRIRISVRRRNGEEEVLELPVIVSEPP